MMTMVAMMMLMMVMVMVMTRMRRRRRRRRRRRGRGMTAVAATVDDDEFHDADDGDADAFVDGAHDDGDIVVQQKSDAGLSRRLCGCQHLRSDHGELNRWNCTVRNQRWACSCPRIVPHAIVAFNKRSYAIRCSMYQHEKASVG